MNGIRLIGVLCILAVFNVSCDSGGSIDITSEFDPDPVVLPTDSVSYVVAGDNLVNMDAEGWLEDGRYRFEVSDRSVYVSTIRSAGLWVAGRQGGEMRASAKRARSVQESNWRVNRVDGARTGVFRWASGAGPTLVPIANWPGSLGAPADTSGVPIKFGDSMVATTFSSGHAIDPAAGAELGRPLDGLTVYQEVFGHDDVDDAVFMRFIMTNTSSTPIDNMHAAFKADMDVGLHNVADCENVHGSRNFVGFDENIGLSYVYTTDEDVPDTDPDPMVDNSISCDRPVSGLLILESQTSLALGHHRRLEKNSVDEWSENAIDTPEALSNTVAGLLTTGDQQVDPTTGAPTPFAYTGDPVADTGWTYPAAGDAVSLVGTEEFDLAPGEHAELILAMITVNEADLAPSLETLRDRAESIASNPELWRRDR